LTDPQAAWVARPGVDPFFAYDANYLIDNKAGIILDAEGTRANRTAEIAVTQTMVERVRRHFDLRPQRLAGDTAYGAVRLLKWLVDRKIAPHVPVWDKSARPDGTFSRTDFVFDRERNIYICPGGAELTGTGTIDQGHIVYYRASKNDCSTCSLKPKCTTAAARKITRDLDEDVRDRVRALANTEAFQQSRRERGQIETPERSTELGAKGVGELGLTGAMGALWVAANDALRGLGATIADQPFTPERIRDAIASGRAGVA
jgi:Transposase DDE domain